MYRILVLILFLVLFCVLIFFNLGKILDATSKPKKVNLLVCLGGGEYTNRVVKTKELYESGYLYGNSIIFTGTQKVNSFDSVNIINPKGLKNTYEEVSYVKNYMKEHGFKSATFVTEAPHSRRILLFSKFFGEGDFEFSVVGSEFDWDAENYYKYPHMRAYVFSEVTKLFYNFFLYGVLDSIGLKESFESYFEKNIQNGKKIIAKGIV